MFTDAKILLRINLQGGTLIRESKPIKIDWFLTLGDVKRGKKGKLPEKIAQKVVRRGKTLHRPLGTKPAILTISLGNQAYQHMTSPDSYELWMLVKNKLKKRDFAKLDPNARLNLHMERLCQHYGGMSYSYAVLE